MAGLSDDLRTRIADSIQAVDDWRGVTDPTILADAVIAELGLRQERVELLTRYVTGWVLDA